MRGLYCPHVSTNSVILKAERPNKALCYTCNTKTIFELPAYATKLSGIRSCIRMYDTGSQGFFKGFMQAILRS